MLTLLRRAQHAFCYATLLPTLACESGQQPRCESQAQTAEDGTCLAACESNEERVHDVCLLRCGKEELRLDGLCQGPKPVRVNSVGYLSALPKIARVPGSAGQTFSLRRMDAAEPVFEAALGEAIENPDTAELLRVADFSEFKQAGRYLIHVPGVGDSAPFTISDAVFDDALHLSLLGFYGMRCGAAVSFQHAGDSFAHQACHEQDAYRTLASNERLPSVGGWHDAGDYGKYGVNGAFSVGILLLAWEQYPAQLASLELPELPEHGAALPDFLAEVRYELDWLLTTQEPDGGVHHKLTAANFNAFILPELDSDKRAFAPVSAEATADFAAVVATAARIYAPYDAKFAQDCRERAERAGQWLADHPNFPAVDLTGFTTGEYRTDASDDRLWAEIALWSLNHDATKLSEIEAKLPDVHSEPNWDWSNVENLPLFAYLRDPSDARNPDVVAAVKAGVLATADGLVANAQAHGYGRSYSASYYWGSNGILARTMLNLGVAYELTLDVKYRDAALLQLDHLFGVNVFGRSQVTGLGYLPPQHPHHRPSGGDTVLAPWPGLLVGGPNGQKLSDNQGYDLSVPAKAWQDVEAAYWSNEVAINWNAPLVYGLAWFASQPPP